jgi:hypothetical protein
MTVFHAMTGSTMATSLITPVVGHVSRTRWSHRFTQGPASVTLRADRTELTASAVATLYAYQRTTSAPSRWTIMLHTAVLIDCDQADTLFVNGTEQDIGPQLTARSISTPNGCAFWIPDLATLVQLDCMTGIVTVYCGTVDAGVHWAARLVRQAMTAQLLQHGALYAHAAAFVHRGVGVLIAGPKGAGKTTTLLAALRLLGGDFVTNDRLLLRRRDDTAFGYAWPMHLRADIGTLRAVPGMSTFLPDQRPPAAPDAATGPADKIAIEPGELQRWLPDGTVAGTVRPRLMLWPHRCTIDSAPEPVADDDVRDTLTCTEFFMHDPVTGSTSHRNHWLLGTAEPKHATATLTDLADLVARTVPCFRVPVTDDPTVLAHYVGQLIHEQRTAAHRSGESQ